MPQNREIGWGLRTTLLLHATSAQQQRCTAAAVHSNSANRQGWTTTSPHHHLVVGSAAAVVEGDSARAATAFALPHLGLMLNSRHELQQCERPSCRAMLPIIERERS